MKKFTLFFSLMFLFQISFGQLWLDYLPAEKRENPNFFDIQEAFRQYAKDNPQIEKSGYKQFKRWEWFYGQRINPKTGEFPKSNLRWHEWFEYKAKHNPAPKGDWVQLGPNSSDGGYAGIGRLNCVSFHPTDENTFWTGSPSGGLWKTTNGGQSWSPLTDQLPVIGVSDIAVNYNHPDTLFIATGDRDGGSLRTLGGAFADNASIGVLMTPDGGQTWQTTGLEWTPANERLIGRLIMHPQNTQILYAATTDGIYFTDNAGQNWTKQIDGEFIDIEFKPSNPQTLYAATKSSSGAEIFRTTDAQNWHVVSDFDYPPYRIDLAVTPADSQNVYAVAAAFSRGLDGIYVSEDAGENFTKVFSGNDANLLSHSYDGSGSGGQGHYDLCIAVSPENENHIFVGGVNNWFSQNKGNNWELNNFWSGHSSQNPNGVTVVHADKHYLKFHPYTPSPVLFECNDGGIYKTENLGFTWEDLSNGLVISQIYRLGTAQSEPDLTLIGLQDNGCKLYDSGNWYDVLGGDGMEVAIDHQNADYMYGTYVNGKLYRSPDRFASWWTTVTISDNIPGGNSGAWVSPYLLNHYDSRILYLGYADIWKTQDRGDTWRKISNFGTSAKIRAMALAPSNNRYIFATDFQRLYKTTDGGIVWQNITSNLPVSAANITYIAVHHENPDKIYVSLGGYADGKKVFATTDGGTTWQNISGSLPNVSANCIVFNAIGENEEIYVGTDLGVFRRDTVLNDWEHFAQNLPNAVVTELEIQYESKKLRAATYGRGLWESDLYSSSNVPNPRSFEITDVGYEHISTRWTNNLRNDSTMLVVAEQDRFGTPLPHAAYLPGDTIAGGGKVIYLGTDTNFVHSGLSPETSYFYKIFSVNQKLYSSGKTVSATTPCDVVQTPFAENFDKQDFPPSCWRVFRGTNDMGTENDWKRTDTETLYGSPGAAMVENEDVFVKAQDWLVTPKIALTEPTSLLLFHEKQSFDDDFWNSYRIKISTLSQDKHSDFQDLIAYGESSFSNSYTQRIVDLSQFNNQEIYIAFVMENDMGDNWFIDNVRVESGENASIQDFEFQKTKNFELFPNPAKNQIYLHWKKDLPTGGVIKIFDMQGQKIFRQELTNISKASILRIDASRFEKGVYNVLLYSKNQVQSEKIVVE